MIGTQGHLDGIEGSDEIEVILFQREEEDVRTQSKLELTRHNEIAIDSTYFSELVFIEAISDSPITVRNICAQVFLYIQHEVILKSHFQLLFYDFCHHLREGFCFLRFLRLTILVAAEVEGDIHGSHESAREIFDVHFGHIAEVASYVSRDEGRLLFLLIYKY